MTADERPQSSAQQALLKLEDGGEEALAAFLYEHQQATPRPADSRESHITLNDGSTYITSEDSHIFAWTQGHGKARREIRRTSPAESDVSGILPRRTEDRSATTMMTIHGLAQDILKEREREIGRTMAEQDDTYDYLLDFEDVNALDEEEALNRIAGLRETIISAMDAFIPSEIASREVERAHDHLVLMVAERLTQGQQDEIDRITREKLVDINRDPAGEQQDQPA